MELSEQAPQFEQQQQLALGPGQLLQAGRIQLNMTAKDVADQLRLSVRVIEAIEADDFSNMPGWTFARGYLLSYAGLVSVAEQDVLTAFDSLGVERTGDLQTWVGRHEKRNIAERSAKWVTYGLAAVLLLMVLVWWRNQHAQRHPVKELIAKEQQQLIQSEIPISEG